MELQNMLGKLKKVNLRSVWKNEEYHFSQWMAMDENIKLLSDEIGIPLFVKETEKQIGRYSLDVLAGEEGTDNIVVIENQLEITDHDHLGKIITYGAGINASYLVWIVAEIRDEHLQAIEWINNIVAGKVGFFLVKIELWQIDSSLPSPKFTVYAKPNEFANNLKLANLDEITDTKKSHLEFWTKVKDYIAINKINLKLNKADAKHWISGPIGTSEGSLSLTVNSMTNEVAAEIYISDNKDLFKFIKDKLSNVSEMAFPGIEWMELPEKKASRVIVRHKCEAGKESSIEWLVKTAIFLRDKISPEIKAYPGSVS